MGEQITVEQLYHKSWYKELGLSTLLFILYVPFGLLLFIIRSFILLQLFILGTALTPSKFRQTCLRMMSTVLGITVSSHGKTNLGAGKIYVGNHITNYDHFAIHLTTNAIKPTKEKLGSILAKPLGLIEMVFESLTKEKIESSEDHYILFPEGDTTNGEVGCLAFSAVEIPLGVVVQPVAIKVSRIFLNSTSVSGKLMSELFMLLFSPNTHFTLEFLPSVAIDSEGGWRTKIQSEICRSLKITPTKFDSSDKIEFVKRLNFRPPSIATMAREVQRKLAPQTIPPELIISTLQATGSVEATLESLRKSALEGALNPPPSTFSKSATTRMLSFQERKRIMIAAARQKYMEAHNIVEEPYL